MGAEEGPITEARQVTLLLCVAPEPHDGTLHGPELRVQREREAIVWAAFAESLHDEHRRRKVDLGAAEFSRHREAEDPEARAALPELSREAALVVALDQRLIAKLALREAARRGATRQLLV